MAAGAAADGGRPRRSSRVAHTMTEQHDNSNSFDRLPQPFWDHWVACVDQANETTRQLLGQFDEQADPQAWRRQWFESLGRNSDAYLRSPFFLQTMKAHIEALVRARRGVAGAPPGAAEPELGAAAAADSSLQRQGHAEQAVLSRLDRLEQRLEALEGRQVDSQVRDGWDRFLRALRVPSDSPPSTRGATPHEVVYAEGSLRLLRYRQPAVKYAEPILICFALVNRPYILDLQEERSVVRRLLERGFEVYLVDWGTPTDADCKLRLQDYVCRFTHEVVQFVCRDSGAPRLNLLGYCMGGTMSTMYTALHQELVRNLILMAAPIDFGGNEGLLTVWARAEYFDVDNLIDAYGNCPGAFLQYCFQLMKPVQNFAEKYLTFCEKLDDEAFLENFYAMERWANDSIPVAGETFREYVKWLYQQNQLVKGEMSLGGVRVKLDAITCPVLLLVAEHDHLVPPSATLALVDHVQSPDVKSMSINAGHIGLAVSSKAHRQLWPDVTSWIAARCQARI